MKDFPQLKGSKLYSFWEKIKDNVPGSIWTNRAELCNFMDFLLTTVEQGKKIYEQLDENDLNIKRFDVLIFELKHSKHELQNNVIKHIIKWCESLKKQVLSVFEELCILKNLSTVFTSNYSLSGDLLHNLRNKSIFIITFHRTGNARPWVSDENIYYGMRWADSISPAFYPRADSLPTNFKGLDIGIECDYTWIYRSAEMTEYSNKQLMENNPYFLKTKDGRFEKLHTFFAHPRTLSLITGNVTGADIMKKRAAMEVTRQNMY